MFDGNVDDYGDGGRSNPDWQRQVKEYRRWNIAYYRRRVVRYLKIGDAVAAIVCAKMLRIYAQKSFEQWSRSFALQNKILRRAGW